MATIAEQLFAAAASGQKIVIREKTGKKYADYAKPTLAEIGQWVLRQPDVTPEPDAAEWQEMQEVVDSIHKPHVD